jgi:hypothetical protein
MTEDAQLRGNFIIFEDRYLSNPAISCRNLSFAHDPPETQTGRDLNAGDHRARGKRAVKAVPSFSERFLND